MSETALWMGELLAHRNGDSKAAVQELAGVIGTTLTDYPLSVELVKTHSRPDQG